MKRTKSGFTLVELSLSMTFISVLLLMVTFIILQMTSIYQKTMTVKAVNDTGQQLIDDFSRRIRASILPSTRYFCSGVEDTGDARANCEADGAYKFIYHQYTARIVGRTDTEVPTSGVFCTGQYSYIWNTGYSLDPENERNAQQFRALITYPDPELSSNRIGHDNYRLVRVYDNSNSLCADGVNMHDYSFSKNADDVVYNLSEEPAVLIDSSESELALYDLRIFNPARHTQSEQAYFSGTFTLSTIKGDVDIMSNGDYCKSPPGGTVNDFTYCAINKFNFASQATGDIDD